MTKLETIYNYSSEAYDYSTCVKRQWNENLQNHEIAYVTPATY